MKKLSSAYTHAQENTNPLFWSKEAKKNIKNSKSLAELAATTLGGDIRQ